MRVEEFAGSEPRFRLEEYFDGRTRAWGLFQDRFGQVKRQFVVDIEGRVEDDTLILIEDFRYADGETEQRIWRIRRAGEHRYVGTAEGDAPGGVVGQATGAAYGNAFNWTYTYDLPVGGRTVRVTFDDWMFLQPGGVVINRASVTKLGFELGEAIIFFRQLGEDTDAPAETQEAVPAH